MMWSLSVARILSRPYALSWSFSWLSLLRLWGTDAYFGPVLPAQCLLSPSLLYRLVTGGYDSLRILLRFDKLRPFQ
ncbi:uncharacterized protein F5891DRAFT_1019255 [Suillus fuscotomentosus]|uniref:Secreted protein n=1 Tax=Suillus fuscotomentosus TaxID=1912939 RepID=A0AAD4EC27_9AGAM|nr:uncharacterized protein F5891DRAFT_1019255 [Suillus fuscotomentosus]KAG1903410.1 hypothetical protein F5891DRAFT_1019255 [Suillus fuscotomentosus]